ncbi:extracellular solute-binding protein [Paenibacillus cymbidii]|uniref:extracellular solute-binding protein n=1 Tax=Paenibacillus cymbidii TaxID=1639034 RepID=UPI001080DB36|nr:extracellular solute-binding protein [Paenibacillus cymbidii]
MQRGRVTKGFAATLATLLTVGTIAACSSKDSGSAKPADSAAASKAPSSTPAASMAPSGSPGMKNGKFDPPVTLTTVRGLEPVVKFRDGETIENNVHTKWAKEKLGIDIKHLWVVPSANNAYETKLRLALSAKETMPDVLMVTDRVLVQDLISSGQFMDVGDVFEKKASASWKKAMQEVPYAWNAFSKDGKRYGIPTLGYGYGSDPVIWIREDWLKKLNLKAPTTIDELEKVMDAFTTQDPDGNGKNDTYGLGANIKGSFQGSAGDISWLFGAFGVVPDQWNKMADGKIAYGSIQPEMKQGLAKLQQWIKKGWMPLEATLIDNAKTNELLTQGRIGIIAGPQWLPWSPFPSLLKNVPGAEMKAYKIPIGPDGKAARHGTDVTGAALLLNKNIKPEALDAFFVYQNYMYDYGALPQKGSEFENGWYEGYDWAMVDGKPSRDAAKIPGGAIDVKKYFLTWEMPLIPSASVDPMIKRYKGETLTTPNELLYKDHPEAQVRGYGIIDEQKELSKVNVFIGAPTKTMKSKLELLNKMKQESLLKIVFGDASIDSFDAFVKDWKATGGDEITNEVNEWYKSSGAK